MKHKTPRVKRIGTIRRRFGAAGKVALCLAAATAAALACGWPGTDHSVRFNDFQTEREMARLPPLPTLANGKTELRDNWDGGDFGVGPGSDYEDDRLRGQKINALWDGAEAAEQGGELGRARGLLGQYLEATEPARDSWLAQEKRQPRRNSATDRLDALAALDGGAGACVRAVQSYLDSRRAFDAAAPAGEVLRRLDTVPARCGLDDNVAYLRAATSYREGDYAGAADAFARVAARYPRGEKREAALYMAAVATMKTSGSFTGTSGDQAHLLSSIRRDDSLQTGVEEGPPLAECCDAAWREARDAFTRYLARHPRGRYAADARGWVAYLRLRDNDRAGALAEYYRLLGDEADRNARLSAAFSLTLVRHHATDEEMRRVEAELEDEPAAALAYAYHNLYNYAVNPGCASSYDYPDNEWEARTEEERKDSVLRTESARVAAFASRLMRRYPRAGFSSGFALRAAAANLELGENRSAAEQAGLALSLAARGTERDRALWVKGVAQYRLRDYDGARLTLSALAAENPGGELTEGARRLVAMAAEDAGDLDAALDQYLVLKYDTDVAYFIDVLMTPEQLAGYIERRPDFERRDEFLYALGVRYMRASRWDEARAAFGRVQATGQVHYLYNYRSTSDCHAPKGFEYRCNNDPKETDSGPGVTARLLMRDLRTIDDLQRLEREAARAVGDEAKAEALYQLASYLFESSTLLFYNPIAWQSVRHYRVAELQRRNEFRAPGESQRLWRDMQEHEPVARALVIYLEVARLYPRTRAARDALYTAAVCHERLSEYNEYWRAAYAQGSHPGERMVTYDDVKAAYPNYQLPRGTYRWEPVTRTVRGGPAWDAPPKPRPRLTFAQRMKVHAGRFWGVITAFWEGTARYWVMAALTFACAFYASYLAGRARLRLRLHLGGRRAGGARRRRLYLWLAAYRRGGLSRLLRDEARFLARRARRRSLRLLLSAHGRSLLALNAAAHALLLALLLMMVKTMAAG